MHDHDFVNQYSAPSTLTDFYYVNVNVHGYEAL